MRVYLDDIRECPEEWVLARTYQEAIDLLKTGKVETISLDHDLGDVRSGAGYCDPHRELTGYDVACWIERAVLDGKIPIPRMRCHSANPVGKQRINQVIQKIKERRLLTGT